MTDKKNRWVDSKYLQDFGILKEKSGQNVVYQSKYYTEEQFSLIKKDQARIIFLFGDNERDNTRNKTIEQRIGVAGQAKVAGKPQFEGFISIGVVTVWNSSYGIQHKLKNWEDTFKELLHKIDHGYTIVVPSPSNQDFQSNYHKFFNKERKQIIFHTLGTGIADAPLTDLYVLQQFLDLLEQRIVDKQAIDYTPITNLSDINRSGFMPRKDNADDESKKRQNSSNDANLLAEKDNHIKNLQQGLYELKEMYVNALKSHKEEMANLQIELSMTLRGKTNIDESKEEYSNMKSSPSPIKNNTTNTIDTESEQLKQLKERCRIAEQKNDDLLRELKKLQQENDQLKNQQAGINNIGSIIENRPNKLLDQTMSRSNPVSPTSAFNEPLSQLNTQGGSNNESTTLDTPEQKIPPEMHQNSQKWNEIVRKELKGINIVCWYRSKAGREQQYTLSHSSRIESLSINETLDSRFDSEQVKITKDSPTTGTQLTVSTKETIGIHSKPVSINSLPLPDWWMVKKYDLTTIQDVSFYSIPTTTPKWLHLIQKVETTIKDKKIVAIDQIQNMVLWARYSINKMQWMHQQLPEEYINEKFLWFGVNGDAWKDICIQGFTVDRQTPGEYGSGLYLYDNPETALMQKGVSRSGKHQFFICAIVTCGESDLTKSSQKRPLKPKTNVEYETLVDDVESPTLYVIGSERQVYPLLVFKMQ